MAKSKKKAETIFLVCEECGDYNYSLKRKPGGEKLRLKKYCPRLRKHTFHNEKKKSSFHLIRRIILRRQDFFCRRFVFGFCDFGRHCLAHRLFDRVVTFGVWLTLSFNPKSGKARLLRFYLVRVAMLCLGDLFSLGSRVGP